MSVGGAVVAYFRRAELSRRAHALEQGLLLVAESPESFSASASAPRRDGDAETVVVSYERPDGSRDSFTVRTVEKEIYDTARVRSALAAIGVLDEFLRQTPSSAVVIVPKAELAELDPYRDDDCVEPVPSSALRMTVAEMVDEHRRIRDELEAVSSEYEAMSRSIRATTEKYAQISRFGHSGRVLLVGTAEVGGVEYAVVVCESTQRRLDYAALDALSAEGDIGLPRRKTSKRFVNTSSAPRQSRASRRNPARRARGSAGDAGRGGLA